MISEPLTESFELDPEPPQHGSRTSSPVRFRSARTGFLWMSTRPKPSLGYGLRCSGHLTDRREGRVSAPTILPHEFELYFPQRGLTRRVRVVWQKGSVCGVRF